MKLDRNTILLYMPRGGAAGMIQAWYSGERSWVEFRGPAFSDWDPAVAASPFQIAHDSLLGMHCTVLHQDSVLALVRDKHSDFNALEQLMAAEQPHYTPPLDAVTLST
jgi:hypothetical protein